MVFLMPLNLGGYNLSKMVNGKRTRSLKGLT